MLPEETPFMPQETNERLSLDLVESDFHQIPKIMLICSQLLDVFQQHLMRI